MLDHGGDRQRGQGIDDPLDSLVGQHDRIAVPDLDAPVGADGVVPHGFRSSSGQPEAGLEVLKGADRLVVGLGFRQAGHQPGFAIIGQSGLGG